MLASLLLPAANVGTPQLWGVARTVKRVRSVELAPGVWITRTRTWVSIAKLETNADLPVADEVDVREALSNLGPPDWHEWALCRGMSLADFFGTPSGERPTMKRSEVSAARRTCGACPVVRECLDSALSKPETHGVWGGTSGRQRTKMGQSIDAGQAKDAVIDAWLNTWLV